MPIVGLCSFFIPFLSENAWIGPLTFWVIVVISGVVSKSVAGMDWKTWFKTICFAGVRKLSRTMTKLSKEVGQDAIEWWEAPFEIWWGICIKFWCPFAIFWLLMYSFKADTEKPYGGYHAFWQWMGYLYPIGGFISFLIPLIVCTEKDPDNDLVDEAFNEADHAGCGVKDIFELINKKAAEDKKKGKLDRRPSEKDIEVPGMKTSKVEQTPAINDEEVKS